MCNQSFLYGVLERAALVIVGDLVRIDGHKGPPRTQGDAAGSYQSSTRPPIHRPAALLAVTVKSISVIHPATVSRSSLGKLVRSVLGQEEQTD